MKEETKDTLVAVIICAAFLLTFLLLTTNSFIGYLVLPIVAYSAGAVFGRIKNDKWNWKDGLRWGAIGVVASILFSFAQ